MEGEKERVRRERWRKRKRGEIARRQGGGGGGGGGVRQAGVSERWGRGVAAKVVGGRGKLMWGGREG